MKYPHCTDPEFIDQLSNWTKSLIQREELTKQREQRIKNLESAISWLHGEIDRLKNTKDRKTHRKHLNNLKYQLRHREIELAFILNDSK